MRTTFEYQLTESEGLAALKFNNARLLRRSQNRAITGLFSFLAFVVWFGLAYSITIFASASSSQNVAWLFLLLAAAVIVPTVSRLVLNRALLRNVVNESGALEARRAIHIEASGLRFSEPNSESFVAWNGIHGIEELSGQILIYLNKVSFVSIPDSAFSSREERAEFLTELRKHVTSPDSPSDAIYAEGMAARASGHERGRQAWLNLPNNLWQGLRLSLFLRPNPTALRMSWTQLVALAALGLAPSLIEGLLRIGPSGSFSWYALPGALFALPVMVLAAWALALAAGRPRRTLALVIAFLSLVIFIDIAQIAISSVPDSIPFSILPRHWSYLTYYLPSLWIVLAVAVGSVRLLGIHKRQWLTAAVITVLTVGAPLSLVSRDGELWVAPYDEAAQAERQREHMALAAEDTFYLQPKLLERELAALKPGRKGMPNLYFLGVAGYSSQDVFMKEVQSVSKLFMERFDTAGHSAMLINNAKTVTEIPIASTTSLSASLTRIAEIMDRNEDILFLYLTSHGSKDHKFSLSFWPMQFNTLDPKRLREILDKSGIKHRVVVISACYAGGFIDALKNDNTLVIAAAAPDKNSFGCSNESDFTYFGKAYFDEALRKTYSFVDAFEMAKPVIAERERKEDYAGSNPQIFVGENIRQRLDEFARAKQAAASRAIVHTVAIDPRDR